MFQEIDQLINGLKTEGYIREDMTQPDVIKLVYSLMLISSRDNVNSVAAMFQRCSFVRRYVENIIKDNNCPETLDMLKKNGIVAAMAAHFQLSHSHAYSVCSTCIQMLKHEFKIK